MKKKIFTLLALMTVGMVCAKGEPNHVMRKVKELGHSQFYGIVKKSDKMWNAATDLKTPYIVLVPNDAQMKSTVGKLMKANPKQGTEDVKDALMQHVVIADKNTLDHDIMAGTDQLNAALSEGINSMGGGSITIDGKKVLLDDEEAATVVDGPHKTDNGYVYTISKVLELE